MAKENATYVHGHHTSVVQSHARRTAQDSMAFVLPQLKPTDNVLDLGCGPGSITADLAALLPAGHITGGDSVESVLAQARQHASARALTNNTTFTHMDANALPFPDATFDAVLAHQLLQHVSDPVGVLAEMRRVTRPGGFVAARDADYASFAWFPETDGLETWARAYGRVARAGGGNPNAARYLPSWAVGAGFERARVQYSWSAWHYEGEQARAWAASWAQRAVHSGFAGTAREHGILTEGEVQAVSDAWRAWGEEEDAFIRIPSGEILCWK